MKKNLREVLEMSNLTDTCLSFINKQISEDFDIYFAGQDELDFHKIKSGLVALKEYLLGNYDNFKPSKTLVKFIEYKLSYSMDDFDMVNMLLLLESNFNRHTYVPIGIIGSFPVEWKR